MRKIILIIYIRKVLRNPCNDLKTDIMEVNGKDFSSYPVELQRDIIIKLIQICSPDDLRLVS